MSARLPAGSCGTCSRASVNSLSSSVATSTDLNYFVTMGPVLVYEPAG